MSLVVAVDVGTTTARAGLFDESGERIAAARRRLAISHPFPGAVEQDPAEIVAVTIELLRVVLDKAGIDAAAVAALGIANQRSTIVAWDAGTGEPLRPAIGWQDTRTADRVAEFVAQDIPLTTSASCSKLEWLLATDDSVREAASRGALRLGTVDTWLTWALSEGSAHVTDPSNAGATGLYDLNAGDWSDGALDLFGVAREPLAMVVASDAVVATTPADLFGAEIPLAARAGDQQAACVAHGTVDGAAKLTLGTSAMLDVGTGAAPVKAPAGTYALPLWRRTVSGETSEEFMVEASAQTAGAVVEWLVTMGLLDSVEHLDTMVGAAASGVRFLPALAGLGSPWQDPETRGVLTGIGLDTRPADVVRAAVDGIADRVADLAETLEVTGALPVDGGLSRSRHVLQAVADATGLPIRPATDPETTLRGAAMLAASGPDTDLGALPPSAYREDVVPVATQRDRRERRDRWHSYVDAARTDHRADPD